MTKQEMIHLCVELNLNEIECRIAEGTLGLARPAGMTAKQAMDLLDAESKLRFRRAAELILAYLNEQTKNIHRVQ